MLPRLALGCMGFGSSAWRSWVLDEAESLAGAGPARSRLGVTFFDTANVYSTGRSEMVLGKMPARRRRRASA
jgi:aryl-alcohol dehydrogenase-like predicted oxidoreductase